MIHAAHAMSVTLNGNGNGNGQGAPSLIRQLEKKAAKTRAPASPHTIKESRVTFQSSENVELSGTPVRVTRHAVYFELYSPSATPRFSEVLEEFKIILQGKTVYSGRATARNVLDAGSKVVCEATLRELDWTDLNAETELLRKGEVAKEFKAFLNDWQKLSIVSPEFKVVMADMQTFLQDLRLWLERVELRIKTLPINERPSQEREVARQLEPTIVPAIKNFFERFEELSGRLDEDARPAHYAFGMRSIHSLLLGSPFVRRTFNKPLGYAGDYEMVNMMFRDPFEGESLFAKMINLYALQLPPIVAHRNRITYLCEKLEKESLRVMSQQRDARVFNLGCGPAHEVQRFLVEDELANHTHFTLADFNEETLEQTSRILSELKSRYQRRGKIQTVKRPVQQLLKEAGRIGEYARCDQYDLIYCAGLFDYLSDQVCRQLMEVFYAMLLPGGLLIATNVDDHPAQNQMECFLEWHLVHRNENKMRTIVPAKVATENVTIKRDPTAVNIFIEVRKPSDEK
jgi:extracellular factor (EF) 3-hydroxypalmitic acid methyl ester biosynthesis protein